eukprot:Colp12_sorted_trinity150504_noHs@12936
MSIIAGPSEVERRLSVVPDDHKQFVSIHSPRSVESLPQDDTQKAVPGALFGMIVLTIINLLNYVDRYVPSAVKDLLKKDLELTDAQTSAPITVFLVVYMVTSPIFAYLADAGYLRKRLIAGGVVLWSLATAAAALCNDFWSFLACRAFVGVGEAAYASIAPAIISDYYPARLRNRALSIYYMAIPVGSAIGYTLGGAIGDALGWRYAFVIAGLPGVLIGILTLFIAEPPLGHFDTDSNGEKEKVPWLQVAKSIFTNGTYMFILVGMTLITFGSGGMADWLPTFLERVHGMDATTAGSVTGVTTVAGGIGGTLAGGIFGDLLKKKMRSPYLFVSGIAMLPSVIASSLILVFGGKVLASVLVFIAQFFLWFYNGPTNALTANCVPANIRARAFGLQIFIIHALGDAISPPIIGAISDSTGNLTSAIVLIPISLGLGGIVWLAGAFLVNERALEDDQQSLTRNDYLNNDKRLSDIQEASTMSVGTSEPSIIINRAGFLGNEQA